MREGTITIGDPASTSPDSARTCSVDPFYISKSPITNEQYEAFDPTYKRAPWAPEPRHIAFGISFVQAQAYCDWYAEISKKPTRLPTELEWEYACRGESESLIYWKDQAEAAEFVRCVDTLDGKEFLPGDWEHLKPNPSTGLHSMLGGAWEWTCSDFKSTKEEPSESITPAEYFKALRGGCFETDLTDLSASMRIGSPVTEAGKTFGFRIVRPFRR